VDAYPTPCPASAMPSQLQAQQSMISQLKKNGFDTSSLDAVFK